MNLNLLARMFSSSVGDYKGAQYSSPGRKAFSRAKRPDFDQALQSSPFFAALRIWVEILASLPIDFFEKKDGEWVAMEKHPLFFLFRFKPNRYQTKTEFFQTVVLNLMAMGNAYVLIKRNITGEIISLLPLASGQVTPKVLDGGLLIYIYDPGQGAEAQLIEQKDLWHLKLFGNTLIGMSPLEYGANSIGLGLSADERTTQVFDNASKPSGILTYDSEFDLTDEQRTQLKQEFRDLKEGKDNVLMTIESGWKYQMVGLNPSDIQLLETRKFQVEEISRIMNVPSVLINDTTGTTSWGSGISEIVNGWYKIGIRPRALAIAESMLVNLLGRDAIGKIKIQFNFDGLLQLSRKELAETQQKEINGAIITPREARSERNLPRKEGDDQLLINTALQALQNHLAGNPNDKERQPTD